VIEAPGAVEAEVLGELHAAHDLVPRHPLLRDIETETHRRNLRAAPAQMYMPPLTPMTWPVM